MTGFVLPEPLLREGALAAAAGERVLVLAPADDGGSPSSGAWGEAWVIDLRDGAASAVEPPPAGPDHPSFEYELFALGTRWLLLRHATYDTSPVPPVGGAAFDPATGGWTAMAAEGAPPFTWFLVWPRVRAVVGGRLFWWNRGPQGVDFADGRSYDADTDRWSPISAAGAPPPAADPRTLAVTGPALVVWGNGSAGGRFDAATGTWTTLVYPEPVPGPTRLVERSAPDSAVVIAWDAEDRLHGVVWDLPEGRPTVLAPSPGPVPAARRSRGHLAWTGRALVLLEPGGVLVWDRATDRWFDAPLPFAWPYPADGALAWAGPPAAGRLLFEGAAGPPGRLGERFDVASGAWCGLDLPAGVVLPAPGTPVFADGDPVRWIRLGSAWMEDHQPPCPPGAPCARWAPERHTDPAGVVIRW